MGWRGIVFAVAAGPLSLIACGREGALSRGAEGAPKRPIVSELVGRWELDAERTLQAMLDALVAMSAELDPSAHFEPHEGSRSRLETRLSSTMVVLELRSDGRADLTLGDAHGLLRTEAAWRPRPGGALLQGEGGTLDLEVDGENLRFVSEPAIGPFYLKRR